MDIILILSLCIVAIIGYISNGLIPFSVPISNIVLYKFDFFYYIILLTIDLLWCWLLYSKDEKTLRILGVIALLLSVILTIFDLKSGLVHIASAAMLITLMSIYSIRLSMFSEYKMHIAISCVPLFLSPIMISMNDVAVSIVELVSLLCIGFVLCVNSVGFSSIRLGKGALNFDVSGIDLKRLIILGGMWAVGSIGVLSIAQSGKSLWVALLVGGNLSVYGAYCAFKIYRDLITTGAILLFAYIIPLFILDSIGGISLSSIGFTMVVLWTVVAIVLIYFYDEYIEDIL